MDQSNINLTTLRAFLSILPLGLVCYVAVVIGARFASPARRYAVRLIGMSVVTLIWYACQTLPTHMEDQHGGRRLAPVRGFTGIASASIPSGRGLWRQRSANQRQLQMHNQPANHRPGVDAGWRALFAFEHARPRATQAGRSGKP